MDPIVLSVSQVVSAEIVDWARDQDGVMKSVHKVLAQDIGTEIVRRIKPTESRVPRPGHPEINDDHLLRLEVVLFGSLKDWDEWQDVRRTAIERAVKEAHRFGFAEGVKEGKTAAAARLSKYITDEG
jgi:hypothetical protein